MRRILVIDPQLPTYDRASGSRRLFEMLKLLAQAGHAVTFVARDGRGQERYAAELRSLGIEVFATDPEKLAERGVQVVAPKLDLPQLLERRQFDLAVLSFFELAEQYLPEIREHAPRTRVWIDTVDLHYVRERRQAVATGDAAMALRAEQTRVRELDVYRRADGLIAITEAEQEELLRELPSARTCLVPNIHRVANRGAPWSERQGLLFVGNFHHPPNADAVVYFCREVLPLVREQLPDLSFTIVGNAPPPVVRALGAQRIEVTGYVPDTAPFLNAHRVSVAPLRFGAGMKGKVGEALAAGLPVVTTSVGAEGIVGKREAGPVGLLVEDGAADFAAAVVRLYRDPVLWERYSVAGRKWIRRHFAPEVAAIAMRTLVECAC